MVNSIRIGISGKANSGKNTTARLLDKYFRENNYYTCKIVAFADPIKEMIKIMFPELPRKFLYGSSKYRSEIIPNAIKDGKPLTVRQLLIDLGSKFGRGYNDNIWINNFDFRIKKYYNVIVTDTRFVNEFDYLKNNNFFMIKIIRNNENKIHDESETNQDQIKNDKFDYILDNNGNLNNLKNQIKVIGELLKK